MTEPSSSVLGGQESQRRNERVMLEMIRTILEWLTPEKGEGPTMGELLAQLIEMIGNVDVRAKRIMDRLEAMRHDLPANIVALLNEERGQPMERERQA